MRDEKLIRRRVRRSQIVSGVSISLVLFLLGSVGYLMMVAMQYGRSLQQSVTVTVELRKNLPEERRDSLQTAFAAEPLVRSVVFSSKEEKIEDEEFRRMFAGDIEQVLGENPLFDSFDLQLTERSADRARTDSLVAHIERIKGVQRVSYPIQNAERMHTTVRRVKTVLWLFFAALMTVSLILLANTVRLAIFSRRYLINTMKLVGATPFFIMRPFLRSAAAQGALSGLAASLLFIVAVWGLEEAVPELLSVSHAVKLTLIVVGMTASGIVLSLCFTAAAVNRFVKMKTSKIHLF